MRRKIYSQLLEWKEKRSHKEALLIDGARRVGKSWPTMLNLSEIHAGFVVNSVLFIKFAFAMKN